jgi:hypothetical protein
MHEFAAGLARTIIRRMLPLAGRPVVDLRVLELAVRSRTMAQLRARWKLSR